ncbi:Mss4-like protein [Schizophyllum amplum]|uniref:Mss4-like protein n=1 Tax=Schizophyllum amplum TaxID=97359 RepID=A0A550CUC9_9AGAR|nr:Mss4-like protein [Auriculariopsis ampla]
MIYKGGCFCKTVRYELDLASPDDARMNICHCPNCKKFTGSEFGITAKIPWSTFKLTAGETKKHKGDNGSGGLLTREFCGDCGLDEPDALPPKGEFFTKYRAEWMPEIPNVFHKKEIKE